MKLKGPYIIGGIGGSGTRLIANILNVFDTFIGFDLNPELDNLTFTFLFKRPKWLYKNIENKKRIIEGLNIFENIMLYPDQKHSLSEYLYIYNALFSMYVNGHNHKKNGSGDWAIQRFKEIQQNKSKVNINRNMRWGWKEPNVHLLLPHIHNYFSDYKYIHVIRNGLDMAYSSNQQQLFNWGNLYGVSKPKNESDIPKQSLNYWIAANKRAIDFGNNFGKEKFHLANFDKISKFDPDEIKELLDFMDIKSSHTNLSLVKQQIKKPASIGRHQKHKLDWVTEQNLEEIRNLGFDINR